MPITITKCQIENSRETIVVFHKDWDIYLPTAKDTHFNEFYKPILLQYHFLRAHIKVADTYVPLALDELYREIVFNHLRSTQTSDKLIWEIFHSTFHPATGSLSFVAKNRNQTAFHILTLNLAEKPTLGSQKPLNRDRSPLIFPNDEKPQKSTPKDSPDPTFLGRDSKGIPCYIDLPKPRLSDLSTLFAPSFAPTTSTPSVRKSPKSSLTTLPLGTTELFRVKSSPFPATIKSENNASKLLQLRRVNSGNR